jgi:hypothetical protein
MRGRAGEGEKTQQRAPEVRRYAHMIAVRLLIVVACMAVAACSSSSSLEHSMQRPGEPAVSGLQVPPDVWARPTQTASLPSG